MAVFPSLLVECLPVSGSTSVAAFADNGLRSRPPLQVFFPTETKDDFLLSYFLTDRKLKIRSQNQKHGRQQNCFTRQANCYENLKIHSIAISEALVVGQLGILTGTVFSNKLGMHGR